MVGPWTRLGVVLEDFVAPILVCKCGGDAEAPNHARSLLHLQWEWRNQPPDVPPTPRTFGPQARE